MIRYPKLQTAITLLIQELPIYHALIRKLQNGFYSFNLCKLTLASVGTILFLSCPQRSQWNLPFPWLRKHWIYIFTTITFHPIFTFINAASLKRFC